MSKLELTPEQRRLGVETIEAMDVHQRAHAMWGEPVEKPDGTKDCPVCGLTWVEQLAAVRQGWYACAYASLWRGRL